MLERRNKRGCIFVAVNESENCDLMKRENRVFPKFNICLSLLLTVWSVGCIGQKVLKEVPIEPPNVFKEFAPQLKGLGDGRFFLVTKQMDFEFLTMYNENLESIYELPLQNSDLTADIEYIDELNQILIIEKNQIEEDGDEIAIVGSLLLADNGKKIMSDTLIAGEDIEPDIMFSEDRTHFIFAESHKKGKEEKITICRSRDLKPLYSISNNTKYDKEVSGIVLSNDGNVVLLRRDYRNVDFEFYNLSGELLKTVSLPGHISTKQNFWTFHLIPKGNQKYHFCATIDRKAFLEEMVMWEFDFDAMTVEEIVHYKFDQDAVLSIFKNFFHRETVIPGEKPATPALKREVVPRRDLKYHTLSGIHYDKNDNIIFVLELLYGREYKASLTNIGFRTVTRTYNRLQDAAADKISTDSYSLYKGEDIIVMSFTPRESLNWASVLERRTSNYGFQHGIAQSSELIKTGNRRKIYFSQGVSAIRTVSYSTGNTLHLINYETFVPRHSTLMYRKLDLNTGDMVVNKPLIDEERYFLNRNYLGFPSPGKISMYLKKGPGFGIVPNTLYLTTISLED